MYGWLTFYHQGHEASKDCKPYMTDLQIRVQNVSTTVIIVDMMVVTNPIIADQREL